MLNLVKSFFDTAGGVVEKRRSIYPLLSCLSAILLFGALATDRSPSETAVSVASHFGLFSGDKWSGANTPGFLLPNAELNLWALRGALFVLIIMPAFAAWRTRRAEEELLSDLVYIIGAPAASTFWILLLLSAQYGPVMPSVSRWNDLLSGVLGLLFVVYVVLALAYAACPDSLVGFLLLWVLKRVGVFLAASTITLVAVVLAALLPVVSAVAWMASPEARPVRRSPTAADN